jgi:hypothetical protein
MSRYARPATYRALLLGLITLPLLGPMAASAQVSDDQPIYIPIAASTVKLTSAYWTEERMKTSAPMPLPTPNFGLAHAQGRTATPPTPSEPSVIADSGRPGDTPRETVMDDPSVKLQEGPIEPLFGSANFVFSRYRLFPDKAYIKFPYRTIGKLFFTVPGQGNYVCSASVVNAANQSVVWTAGHCLASPNPPNAATFHTNFLFVPGRRAGVSPFGSWTATGAAAPNGWLQSGLAEYDHGALVMSRGGLSNGKIGDVVGFLGFVANVARQQHWHLHGYPAGLRDLATTAPGVQFSGEHQEICAAAWATNDQPSGNINNPPTVGVGCDKTGGTSGGPWLIDMNGLAGPSNLLNGNNSYRYVGGPPNTLQLYSPYFGTAAINLRNFVQAIIVP